MSEEDLVSASRATDADTTKGSPEDEVDRVRADTEGRKTSAETLLAAQLATVYAQLAVGAPTPEEAASCRRAAMSLAKRASAGLTDLDSSALPSPVGFMESLEKKAVLDLEGESRVAIAPGRQSAASALPIIVVPKVGSVSRDQVLSATRRGLLSVGLDVDVYAVGGPEHATPLHPTRPSKVVVKVPKKRSGV